MICVRFYDEADADYTRVLSDDAAIIRILAREHDEITSLISLDASGVDNLAQEMYLLHKGFVTGKEVPLASIAKRFGLPETETAAILSSTEAKVATELPRSTSAFRGKYDSLL